MNPSSSPRRPPPPRSPNPTESCQTVDLDVLHLPKNDRIFALRVRGCSMQGAGILDGDNVLLEFRDPKHGDIVAALIDGESSLKRYVVQNGRAFLRSEHPSQRELVPAQELVIQGVMVALLRLPSDKNPRV